MSIIGKSINRVGGIARVTGSQEYVGDISLPGMLHAKLVHLNCAHARILSIDTSKAEKFPGVVSILTGEDIPSSVMRFGPAFKDRPLLAMETTQFHGEPVAIVAAETEFAAANGAALVKVEYEELPAVFTIEQALDPESELVQDPKLRAEGPYQKTNILNEWRFGWGDVDDCEVDSVVENEYTFPIVTHFAIEPFAFLAEPTGDGISIYSAIQNPFQLQRMMADVLSMPVSRVRIIAPDPGGAFGGKQQPKFEPVLAYFALKLGRPLRLELTLEESFQAARRASAKIRIRSGFLSDGTLVFQDIQSDYLIGAYVDIAARVVSKASYVGAGPYRVPNVRIVARALLSHTLPSTAFRGFGIPQINWALESQMDAVARSVGIDRVSIRLKNLPERGEEFLKGDTPADGIWAETIQKAAAAIKWGTPLAKGRGRGISMGLKMGATTGASYTIVRLHMDGSATVFSGTSDMGQGARTIFSQIASEELGIPVDRIVIAMGDTTAVPFDLQTSASRSTVFMGNAIIAACQDIKDKIQAMAAESYDVPEDQIKVKSGEVRLPKETIPFQKFLGERFGKVRGEVIGVGSVRSEAVKGHPMGGRPAFYELVCTATEVEVDPETGQVNIFKMCVASDVGKALNAQHVEMQDEGAAIMGLGHSLMEQFIFDDNGRIKNLGALDYRIPTSKDIPLEFHTISIENMDGPGPYGAKGVSESGILSIAPSIAGAVEEATGCRIRDLPLTSERIWTAMNRGTD